MQDVAPRVQEMLADVLDNSAAIADGGPLHFDAGPGVWQYEGSVLLEQLQAAAAQVRGAALPMTSCVPHIVAKSATHEARGCG